MMVVMMVLMLRWVLPLIHDDEEAQEASRG